MLHVAIFLLLLGAANGTPVLLRLAMGKRWARPLDGGLCLSDGHPIFGQSKTIRGIVSSLAATTGVAWVLGYPVMGAGIAAAAMLGDLFSSFIKRRLGLRSSHDAYGLDQIPESLFPALIFRVQMGLSWEGVAILILVFALLDVIFTAVLHRVESRD
jgi:CDP-diglyceride synthetase